MDQGALHWVLIMDEATGISAGWRSQLSKFEFNIGNHAILKHQSADALSCLKIKDKAKNFLDVEVSVLTIPQEIFAYALKTETADFEFIEVHIILFVHFILEV